MDKVYNEKKECTGCSACAQKCPKQAISMICDNEGYYYPSIRQDLCIDCGLCKKICGNHSPQVSIEGQRYFAAKAKSNKIRMRSRSGGVFFLAAKYVIENNGVAYGAILTADNVVQHIRANNIDDVQKMQGSKYVESDIRGIYSSVNVDLNEGKLVLFSGTPCQVSGLYGFLRGNHPTNLLTMDIVCHGVASPRIFQDYIKFIENRYNGKVVSFDFRDKKYGWNQHFETFKINGRICNRNNYTSLFYSNRCMRPSCGSCNFTSYKRCSDITLADFWGLKQSTVSDFDDNKGVSAVLINTIAGQKLFNHFKGEMQTIEVNKEMCSQPQLHTPSVVPNDRDLFWKLYSSKGIIAIMKKYGRYDLGRRLKWYFWDFPKLKKSIEGK